jgi:alkaline phosphatase D
MIFWLGCAVRSAAVLVAVLVAGLAAGLLMANPGNAAAAVVFSGVAAGDPTSNSAILWTRTVEPATSQPVATGLTAQLAAEPEFRNILFSYKGVTDAVRAGTIKIDATGLNSHAHYFYRFVAEDGGVSPAGRFTTAPRDEEKVAIRFGFSGDTSGAFRPFPLVHRFGELKLDYFIFLGDTMYELPSKGSPAASDPFADPAQALADYRRKYLENILPVKPGGFPGLQALFAAQGNYTLLDNHELGNAQFQSGGAPPGNPLGKGTDATDPANDANGSCSFMNQTPGFAALLQAYRDFEPVRERRVSAPGDCRSDGTWQLYFAQRWGANSIFINLDDRSYRDIQIGDTGPRADNPARTMLGATQLKWLKQVLADAQKQGVAWKIVAISSPIDQAGSFGPVFPWDGPKSWIGGYRAERNDLLKYIADNHIEHVVFLTTDDHLNRVQGLGYLSDAGDPKSRKPVPGAFTVVAGPIGALAPDRFTQHDYASVKKVADTLAADERAAGIEPIGLRPNFPGLKQVHREGDPEADALRQPVDFYSADTFNYVTLEISADGKSLAVDTWGIDSYPANSFPEPSEASARRCILGFRIEAD